MSGSTKNNVYTYFNPSSSSARAAPFSVGGVLETGLRADSPKMVRLHALVHETNGPYLNPNEFVFLIHLILLEMW
jgi:hypothetical protein